MQGIFLPRPTNSVIPNNPLSYTTLTEGVFAREGVTSLKIGRGPVGSTGLKIIGPTNRRYAMIFWARSAPELRAALASGGWMRLLK